jgi:hypothetical protein
MPVGQFSALVGQRKYKKASFGPHSGGNANAFYLPQRADPSTVFSSCPISCFTAVKVHRSPKKSEAFYDLGSSVIYREYAKDRGHEGHLSVVGLMRRTIW